MNRPQFNVSYLLLETLLIALCLGAIRLYPLYLPEEAHIHLVIFVVAVISGCAALGGLALRPAAGAIVGVLIASLLGPLWFLVHASAAA